MPNFHDRLYLEADDIVQDQIARYGQGNLLDAMRTVTAPAILDLVAKGRRNAAARALTRLDGAKVWRNAGKVLGTHALAKKVAGFFLDAGFTTKARMLWKLIVLDRYKGYYVGAKQIGRYERHYKGKRMPKNVVEFLAACHELQVDGRAAFFEGVKEYTRLCDRYRWSRDSQRVAAMSAAVESGRFPSPRRGSSANKTRKMNPKWFKELLAAARRDAASDEWMFDQLVESLEGISITAIEVFKRMYLAEAAKRLTALKDGVGRDLAPDDAEDVATSLIALGEKPATKVAAVRKALKANRAACGGPAFAFDSPDVAYLNLTPHPAILYLRINKDLAD